MYLIRCVLTVLLPGVLLWPCGCRAMAAPFLLWGAEPTRTVPAAYPYLVGKKVCTLVWAESDTLFEYPNVQREIAEFVNDALKSTVRRISFVPPRRVIEYQRRNADWRQTHPTKIGARFGADRVLLIEITRYTTREPNSPHLYRGHINANAKIYDPAYPNTRPVNDRIEIETAYPPDRDGEWGSNDRSIRKATMEAFAVELAQKFYDHKVKVR